MAQIHRNMQTMQQNWKENGFQIFRSMINNTCLSSIFNNLFSCQSKIMSGKSKSLTTCPAWQVSSENYVSAWLFIFLEHVVRAVCVCRSRYAHQRSLLFTGLAVTRDSLRRQPYKNIRCVSISPACTIYIKINWSPGLTWILLRLPQISAGRPKMYWFL